MPTVIPAISSSIGDTEFYLTSMKIRDLISNVVLPVDFENWDDMTLEERFQRDIDYDRVKKEIAPYYAKKIERFSSAIIVAVKDINKSLKVSTIHETEINKTWKNIAPGVVLLTLTEDIKFVPLDGQHRVVALKMATEGVDEDNEKLKNFEPNDKLLKEDIPVIIVNYEISKARSLFSHVNRYAKSTSTNINLITSDNDIFAIIARDIAQYLLDINLVNIGSDNIKKNDRYFTTLQTIYNGNKLFIKRFFDDEEVSDTELPNDEDRKRYEDLIRKHWTILFENITVFKQLITSDDTKRVEIREKSLLARPAIQMCFISADTGLVKNKKFSPKDTCDLMNKIPLDINKDSKYWENIAITSKGTITGKNKVLTTSLMIYFTIGEEGMSKEEFDQLSKRFRKIYPDNPEKTLPNI